jgi:type I restriction enzyme S subunit
MTDHGPKARAPHLGSGPASVPTREPEAPRVRRYKPYATYKNSGVEWLGTIPASWKTVRVTEVGSLLNGYPFDSEFFVRSDGIPLVRIRDLNGVETEVNYIGPVIQSAWIDHGDVIVGMDGDFNVARWRGQRALLNQRMCCLRPRKGFDPAFIAYLLPFPLGVINDLTYSTTVKHLSSVDVRKIQLGAPGGDEQRAIAKFLDGETTRIDTLVAKEERLIELLQEKRLAVITRSITKGIDPKAVMKDSGVQWLGEIPAHWEVKRTKFAARLRSGHTPSRQHPEYWQGCTIPWFGLADVWQIRDGEIEYVTDTAEKISEIGLANSAARLLPKDTVMLSRAASVGFSAIMGVDMATTQDFVNWVCGSTLRPEYLLYVFRSMQHEFHRLTMGSTHQTIYMPDVGNFFTPIPPIQEQDRIVIYVRERIRRVDALVVKVRHAINRLKELRTALISAAVTGKIDVRSETA